MFYVFSDTPVENTESTKNLTTRESSNSTTISHSTQARKFILLCYIPKGVQIYQVCHVSASHTYIVKSTFF